MDTLPLDLELAIFSLFDNWERGVTTICKKWRNIFWRCRTELSVTSEPAPEFWSNFLPLLTMKRIKYLHLYNSAIVPEKFLSTHLIGLERLIIDQTEDQADFFFDQLPLLSRLTQLKLSSLSDSKFAINSEQALKVAQCTQLRALKLFMHSMDTKQLTKLTNLEELKFQLTNTSDPRFINSLSQLTRLYLKKRSNRYSLDFYNLKNLKELYVAADEYDEGILDGWKFSPQLRLNKLFLINGDVVDGGNEWILESKALYMKQKGIEHYQSADMDVIATLKNFQKIYISNAQMMIEMDCPDMSHLKSLTFGIAPNDKSHMVLTLRLLPNLEELELYFAKYDVLDFDDEFAHISNMRYLETLKLVQNPPIVKGFQAIKKLTNLKFLKMDAAAFKQEDYDTLGQMTNITQLGLINVFLDGKELDLSPILKLPNLEILFLDVRIAMRAKEWLEIAIGCPKIDMIIFRNQYYQVSAVRKIYQYDRFTWIQLCDEEIRLNRIIKAWVTDKP